MRIPSATGIVLAAALTAGCATAGPRPLEHPELQNQLGQLGVEGRTYHIDLADTQSIHLHDVHLMGQDLVVEDIHGHLTCLDATTLMPRWDYYGMPTHFDERPSVTPSDIVGVAGGKLDDIKGLCGGHATGYASSLGASGSNDDNGRHGSFRYCMKVWILELLDLARQCASHPE